MLRQKHIGILCCLLLCTSVFGQSVVINEFMSKNECTYEDEDGKTSDWIELFNTTENDIVIDGYMISDDDSDPNKWTFPQVTISANSYLLVFASGKGRITGPGLHTNFKISSSGEPLILSDSDGIILDYWQPIELHVDASYGRSPDGTGLKMVFDFPTPDASNNPNSKEDLVFSHSSGIHPSTFNLDISCSQTVRYTLNGALPDTGSSIFLNPILIHQNGTHEISFIPTAPLTFDSIPWLDFEFGWKPPLNIQHKATVIKAGCFNNDKPSSQIVTQTYFNRTLNFNMPVVAISTDPNDLFDFQSGIYVPGSAFDPNNPEWTGNYFNKGRYWERDGHFEFFDTNGELAFQSNMGLRISGQKTRSAPQKSLRVYARCEYEKPTFEHDMFLSGSTIGFRNFVLRSSFTYWYQENCLFRDDFIQHVIGLDGTLDNQQSRPVATYLNGEYWGISALKETQDKYFLQRRYEVNPDSVDIIYSNLSLTEDGNPDNYKELVDFVESNDLSNPVNFQIVEQQFDMDNYVTYLIFQLYFGNLDWPWNNVRIWRERGIGTKWRFLVYDLDATFSASLTDPFENLIEADIPAMMFNELWQNSFFRESLLNRFTHHLATTFAPERLLPIFDEMASKYEPEVPDHINRWSNPANSSDWEASLEYHRQFIRDRPCAMAEFLKKQFNLTAINFDCAYSNPLDPPALFAIPNPTNGHLNIRVVFGLPTTGTFEVLNTMGEVCMTASGQSGNNSISLSHLSSGLYVVRFRSKLTVLSTKIVVQH
ncbi:MAG: hypothetical protein ACI97X_000378 [Oceanospirillaceae bacterium]|jgi:hypothetical protein